MADLRRSEDGWGFIFIYFFSFFYVGRGPKIIGRPALDVRRNGSPRELSFVFNRCYRLKALLFSFHSSHFLRQTPKILRRKVRTPKSDGHQDRIVVMAGRDLLEYY